MQFAMEQTHYRVQSHSVLCRDSKRIPHGGGFWEYLIGLVRLYCDAEWIQLWFVN